MNEPMHMTDEQLETLLDDALAPAEPPPGLAQRLITVIEPPAPRRAVVARIGDGVSALAAAAMLALVLLGAWALLGGRSDPDTARPASLAVLERELSALDRAMVPDTARVDEQIELLELQLEVAGTDPLWPRGADPLDEAGAQAQLYSLVSEPMWQF